MMTRPRPLRLQLDRNYPPVQPPSRASNFITQLYQANWRNFIIAVAVINTLRFLFSASNAFQDVGIDKLYHVPKLAGISIALGVMYITTAIIDLFGIFSVSMQRLKLIRVYTHLAFVSALLVTVAGFVAGVSYFLLADDVVRECVSLSLSGKLDAKSLFRGEPWPKKVLSATVAHDQCIKAWSTESVTQALSAFLFSFIPSIAYFLLAYTYYRQASDPRHPHNLCISNNGSAIRMEAYPDAPYSPLYNRSAPQHSHDITDIYLRTPKQGKAKTKQPNIQLSLSPVMRTAYMITPGPPSFGPSRDYRPGSGFFTVGSDDGKFV